MFSIPLAASDAAEEDLLEALRTAETEQEASRLERQITSEWSKSGSASMDFLLKRGRDALEVNDYRRAIEHLTALTDHAPDFAEGYHARAMAYFRAELYGPAMGDLERVLALNPNHFGAVRGLAAVFETLGDAHRAHLAYEMVLEMNPNDAEAVEGLERTRLDALGRDL